MTSAELAKLLKANGFALVSIRGSHHKFRNGKGVTVVVPHPKKDLGWLRRYEDRPVSEDSLDRFQFRVGESYALSHRD